MNKHSPNSPAKILPKLLANLDTGLVLCEINPLSIIEYNQSFAAWFSELSAINCLEDLFSPTVIKRVKNAILKQRKYRFKVEVKISHRTECLDFICKPITIKEKHYVMLQGVINSTELQMKKMINEHSLLATKNNELMQQAIVKAEEANNAKTMFIASMSHELILIPLQVAG